MIFTQKIKISPLFNLDGAATCNSAVVFHGNNNFIALYLFLMLLKRCKWRLATKRRSEETAKIVTLKSKIRQDTSLTEVHIIQNFFQS